MRTETSSNIAIHQSETNLGSRVGALKNPSEVQVFQRGLDYVRLLNPGTKVIGAKNHE